MTTDNHMKPSRDLFNRLSETASLLRQHGIMSDSEIATGFLAVGAALAQEAFGPVSAAEWLRDIADHTEASNGGLQ